MRTAASVIRRFARDRRGLAAIELAIVAPVLFLCTLCVADLGRFALDKTYAADFTLTFRRLCDAAADEKGDANVRGLFADPGAYDIWAARWRSRLVVERLAPNERAQAMRNVNPAFIPRNETFHRLPSC